MTTTTSQAATNGYVTVPSSFDPYLFKMLRHCHPSSKSSIPYSSSLTTNELILQHALAQSYYNHSHTHASSGNSTINHNSSNSNTLPPNVAVTKSSLDYVSHYQSPLGSRNNSLSSKLCSTTPSINSTTSTNPMTKTTTTNGNWEEYCTKSLKSGATKETWDQWLQPPLGAVIQGPSCIQADKSGEKSDTTLCGERITCFIVGGEKRLCLPEILNTVLKDFSLQEINSACEKLHIYCSRCTNDQLDVLKITQVLPFNAPSCGLITQTDAERLCAILLQQRFKGHLWSNQFERLYSIKVQHKCFGKCCGLLYPTLYVSPHAECIQCDTCQALFSPKTFVSHGHKSEENRICHWGFNSDNWRSYLKIRSIEDNKAREELELFKEKFSKKRPPSACSTPTNPIEKRFKLLPDWSGNASATVSNASVLFGHNLFKKGLDNSNQSKLEEYPPFGLPRPAIIPSSNVHNDLIVRTTLNNDVNSRIRNEKLKDIELSPVSTSTKEYPLKIIRSISPDPICSSAASITTTNAASFNDFSLEGIKQVVEATVSTQRSRTQLINYISQLHLTLQAKLATALQSQVELHERQNSLQHENDNLRIKIQKLDQENFSLKHRMEQLLTLSSPSKRVHHDPSVDLYTTLAKKLSNHTGKRHHHYTSKTNSPHIKDTTTSSSTTSGGSKYYSSSHSSNSNPSSPIAAATYPSLSSRLGLLLGTTNGHNRHENHQDDSDSRSSSPNSSSYSPPQEQEQQPQHYKKRFCCTETLQVVETSSPPLTLLPPPSSQPQEEQDHLLKEKETKKQHKKLDDIVDSLKEQQKKQLEEDQDSHENVDDDDLEQRNQELFIEESQKDIENDENEDEIEINVDDDIVVAKKTEQDTITTTE